jgi:hypothetical protein
MPALGLRVSGVFDLRHNALKVMGANFRERALAVLLDVLSIKQA